MSDELNEDTEETTQEESVETPEPDKDLSKELETEQKKNAKLYARLKEQENLVKKSKSEAESLRTNLDVDKFIEYSEGLEGLDNREKSRLLQEHKLTGKSLNELRQDNDFKLWQGAYREKVEKEKTPPPSTTQSEVEMNKPFSERLSNASLEEKEKMLTEAGLYKDPRARVNSSKIRLSN